LRQRAKRVARGSRFAGVVLALAVTGTLSAGPAWAPIGSTPDRTWVTDGEVLAVARLGDTIYIGGDFTQVGPRTGPGAGIDAGSGRADPALPEVAGTLCAVAADGLGGWFIGGIFDSVDGVPRRNIAHILAY